MRMQVELIKASVKQLVREPIELLVIIVFPILFVVLFGVVFSGADQPIHYEIGLSGDGESREEIEAFLNQEDMFEWVEIEPDKVNESLEKLDMTLVFEQSEDVASDDNPMDMTVYTKDDETGTILRLILAHTVNTMTLEASGIQPIIRSEEIIINQGDKNALESIIPGILAIVIMQSGLFGALKIATQKHDKTLKNLSLTPLKRHQYIVGEIIVRIMVAFIQSVIVLSMATLIFDFSLYAVHIGQLILYVLLGSAAFVSMGYCIVAWAPSAESANGIIQILQLLMMFLSGVFVSGDLLPDFVAIFVRYNPVAFLADGLKSAIVESQGMYSITVNVAVLLAVGVVFGSLAQRYRWD